MSEGLYLFCLAKTDRLPPAILNERGLEGQAPLKIVLNRDVAAIWSPVAMMDFTGAEAEAKLQDLNWIAPRVIRHQEVVALVMQSSPVLPARFGTIFLSLPNLENILQTHYQTIINFFDQTQDTEEWGVKGLLDRSGAHEKFCALQFSQEADHLQALPPGKRYFEEQRLRARCKQELTRWLQQTCQRLWSDLRTYAAAVMERPLQRQKVKGADKDIVLNWSFLVPSAAAGSFQSTIREANRQLLDRGLELECTGPWPPYSFCPSLAMECAG